METDGGRSSESVSGGVASSLKPPIANTATRARDYAIADAQDPEQRSTSELPARKLQKINKELTKHNTQLVKDVDVLKKEKETLLSEKQKLKSENKTLERELRKVSSKGEVQRLLKNGPAENDQDLVAEQRLLEKERRIETLRKRIEFTLKDLQQDEAEEAERLDKTSPEFRKRLIRQKNGGIWDSGVALEHHVDFQNITSALQKENAELRSRIASLEGELEQMVKGSSPKNSRIKPGNFFRRSKRQQGGDVQKEKLVQSSNDGQRARSPDIPLNELVAFDTPSSSVEGTPVHSRSVPVHMSPNQSPKFDARDTRNSEIQALRSIIKSAADEKKAIEERNKALETELHDVRSQLEGRQANADEVRRAWEEVERVKKSLKLASSEKVSLSGQIDHLRKEIDELKSGKRSTERNMAESLRKKENRIEELEMECSRAKRDCEKLQKELETAKGSSEEVKRKDNKIEELHLECSKMKVECEKLQKELNSTKASLVEAKKKESRIVELETECSRAKKECEKLQEQLESKKSSSSDTKGVEVKESKVTTPTTSAPSHSAAKPPSGARLTSSSHSACNKSVQSAAKTAVSSTVKKAPSSTVTTTADDSVFETGTQSNNKAPSESTLLKLTRKSSGDTVEKRTGAQSRSREPPVLRKRRSSTELIELFENSQETAKPVEKNVKRNTSFAVLAKSVTHRTKVAATRAMFEGKNEEEKTTPATNARSESSSAAANRSAYRRSWTGDMGQLRRSSYTDPASTTAIPESKDSIVSHIKSQSLDVTQQFKSAQQLPPSPTATSVTKATTTVSTTSSNSTSPKHAANPAAPSKPTSLNLGTAKVATTSVSSTPSSAVGNGTPNSTANSLTVTPTSASGPKVSKITIKSSSSSCASPKVNGGKEVNEAIVGTSMRAERVVIPVSSPSSTTTTSTNVSVNQRTRILSSTSSNTATSPAKTPTSPSRSPTTPLKSPGAGPVKSSMRTGSVVMTSSGGGGASKAPSYVPSYVRSNTVPCAPVDSPTVRGGSRVANEAAKPHLTRSQTGVTFTITSADSRPHPVKSNSINSSNAHPVHREQGVLKNGSSIFNDVQKTSSLLDIPENVTENESSTSNSSGSSTLVGNNNQPSSSSESATPAVKVMHRSPVQSRVQRRKREDRPKTMYVGARSETVSLVRLISKYQEQERREKGEVNTDSTKPAAISAPASTQAPAVNGNVSPIPAAATTYSGSTATSTGSSMGSGGISTTAVPRTKSPLRRPQSYYGGSSDL